MNVFDKFLMGDTAGINWCFENRHFINRLQDNGISREYVVDLLMKDYKEIRLLMACSGNSIDLVTVMRNNETTTNRQKKQYQSDKKKNIEKKRLKALSKRKW